MKKNKKDDRNTGTPGKTYPRRDEDTRAREEQERRAESTPASAEGTPIYLYGDSTLQTPEEHRHDEQVNPQKGDSMDVSDSDLEQIKAGRLTGRESGADRDEAE